MQKRNNPRIPLIISIVCLGILGISAISLTIFKNTNSTITEEKNNAMTYQNTKYGFKITYPKYNTFSTTCNPNNERDRKSSPLKVFIDAQGQSLYISDESLRILKSKKNSQGGYVPDFTTCKIVSNSYEMIKKGYENGMEESDGKASKPSITYPIAFQLNWKRIEKDADLDELVHSIYGPNCFVSGKTADKGIQGVMDVHFAAKDGSNGPDSACWTNFKYWFYYSPHHHSAVLSTGFQYPPFDGTNGQEEPKISFLP